jgi:glycolate oxidase FAD binding subunit
VLPCPETVSTVVLCGLDPRAAVYHLTRGLGSPHEISGAAYLPPTIAAAIASLSGTRSVAAFRLEWPPPSVAFRRERLLAELASDCGSTILDFQASEGFWRAVRDGYRSLNLATGPSGVSRSRQGAMPKLVMR